MNILFVGGGRRVELARRFKERGYCVFGYDLNAAHQPLNLVATKMWEGERWSSSTITQDLRRVVDLSESILVLPLMDAAIEPCLEAFMVQSNCFVVGSEANKICSDKLAFEKIMLEKCPNLYPTYDSHDKAVLKSRFGFGSNDIQTIEEPLHKLYVEELNTGGYYILQRYVVGTEYTVDCYFSDGKFIDGVPRRRDRIVGGEVQQSTTIRDEVLRNSAKQVGEAVGVSGPVNIQFIVESGQPYVIEANARFGGGFPLSMAAGFDVISLIEEDYFGWPSHYIPNQWKSGLQTNRYFSEYIYEV